MLLATDSVQLMQRIPYREALEWFGVFKVGGQVISTVKLTDELVLLAKEEILVRA